MNKNIQKILIALVALIVVFAIFNSGVLDMLSLDYIKSSQGKFQALYSENPTKVISIFVLIYIVSTALSLPGAAVLTLAAGALFGLVIGTIIVSFSSTIGATLAFLVSRFLLRDWVQTKFKESLTKINTGIEKEGSFYLFTLRLIPAFPFFMINLVMGLTKMKTRTYFFVSQAGMLAGTIVYVNAGKEIAKIDSLAGILSPGLIASFVALGIFPLIAKKALAFFKKEKK